MLPSSPFRHRSRSRGGIETPDRFAAAHPHPPRVSPRHVSFGLESKVESPAVGLSRASSTDSVGSLVHEAAKGDRDHIHSPQLLSGGRSRIPRDRDVDGDSMKTPTFQDGHGMRRGNSGRRAFACWGQDESDSNASDSDASINEHVSTHSRRTL